MKNFLTVFFLMICVVTYANDVADLRYKANNGDAQAQYQLACYFLDEDDAPTDFVEVLRLLRESSNKGNQDAANLLYEIVKPGYDAWGDYYLMMHYDYGVYNEEVKQILKQRAISGCNSDDCKGHKGYYVVLANSLYNEKDYVNAVYYYKMALSTLKDGNQGFDPMKEGDEDYDFYFLILDATSMLGYCYEHGLGVQKNLHKALAYYSLGGFLDEKQIEVMGVKDLLNEINNSELTENVGSSGLQLYPDFGAEYSRAYAKMYCISLKLGIKEYVDEWNEILESDLIPDDKWNHSGSAPKLLWYGERFYKGIGTQINYQKAFEVFSFIVNELDLGAGFDLYELYPDVYADACYRLYECFAYGRGVEKNPAKAESYFKLALRFGSSSAIYDDQKRYEITH